jgi:3'-phosphoadenosine 5'-phosphosulfate sulfotransferase (PAPS reductase)/FAD synthetase
MRAVVWFSCGAASAVAGKLVLNEWVGEVRIVYTNPGSEHPDNQRFLKDCEGWYDHPIEQLRSEKYEDTWDVFEKTGYLVGPSGARCTTELKKKLRYAFQLPDDRQVFGFTADKREVKRANQFRATNPEVDLWTPLIDRGLTKQDCWGVLDRVGIDMPAMYKLGYENNNCLGCVKGGMGYWNKIRIDFPEVFERMARHEQTTGNTVLREKDRTDPEGSRSIPLPLVDLDPHRGNYRSEPDFSCGPMCSIALEDEDLDC